MSYQAGIIEILTSIGLTAPILNKNGKNKKRVASEKPKQEQRFYEQIKKMYHRVLSGVFKGASGCEMDGRSCPHTYERHNRLKSVTPLATTLLSFLLLLTAFPASSLDNPCDVSYVSIDGVKMYVEPTGADDTNNIQCALDSAVAQGLPMVKLGNGDFFISSVSVTDFNGVLSGVSKAQTSLTAIENSIDCASLEAEQQIPAAILFREGSPRIQNMTVVAESFCSDYGDLPPVLISFTGQPTGTDECSNDVIFGVVDRVNFVSEDSYVSAVSATAAGFDLGGCKQTLLGTLKINRSEFTGFAMAVTTAMRGGAQVDINYNTFERNLQDVNFINSNQSTNVIENKFYRTLDENNSFYASVVISSRDDKAPSQSKFMISGNTFDIDAPDSIDLAVGIYLAQQTKVADLSVSIVGNKFVTSGSSTLGILEGGLNGGFLAKNSFRGNALSAIALGQADVNQSADWTIVANSGLGSFDSEQGDIILGSQTVNTIIGPNQNPQIADGGAGNIALPVEPEVIYVPVEDSGNSVVSNISGAFEGWDGSTVLQLKNGQVWEQAEYHYDYFYAFEPTVVIYPTNGFGCSYKAFFPDEFMPPKAVCVRQVL